MKFLVLFAAVCIGAASATSIATRDEVVVEHQDQVQHEQELAELCKEAGVFANPHDEEGRTFIRCELEPIEMQCDEGFLFNAEKLMCVEKPQPPAPVDLNKVDWRAVLTCPDVEDKYFRNPYDCSKFYRCYKQGPFERMDPMTCLPTMIFDEVLETCLPAEQFKSLYGIQCMNAPLPEDKKPEEETDAHHEEQPEEHKPEEEKPEEHKEEEKPEEHKPEEETDAHHEEKPEEEHKDSEHPEEHKEEEKPDTHEEQPEEHKEEEKPEEHKEEEHPETHEEEKPEEHKDEETPDVHHEEHPEEHKEEEHQPETHEEHPEEHKEEEKPEEHQPETHEEHPEEHKEEEHQPETHEEKPEEKTEEAKKQDPSLNDILKQIKDLFNRGL